MDAYLVSYKGSSPIMSNTLADYSIPVNNHIRMKPATQIGKDFKYTVYGDEVNMEFYKTLNVPFGDTIDATPTTLTEGYSYIWNLGNRTFTILDGSGNLVSQKLNIQSISDLEIDYTIQESHNFAIVLASSYDGVGYTIPVALLMTYFYFDKIKTMFGYINSYYTRQDIELDYPLFNKRLAEFGIDNKITITEDNTDLLGYYQNDFTGLSALIVDLAMSSKYPFYITIDNKVTALVDNKTFNTVLVENGSFVSALITMSLFPALLVTIMPNEFINNRPVYETWLIWDLYRLIYNKPIVIIDDKSGFEVLSISPIW